MARTLEWYQAVVDKGGYDQLSENNQKIVDALVAKGAITLPNAPAATPPPVTPPASGDTSGKQDAIDLGWLNPNGPPNRNFLESALQGAMKFPQAMAGAGEQLLKMGANPDKSVPMMKDIYSGALLNLAPGMGQLKPHTPEQSRQMGMAADVGRSYKEDFGSYQGFLNTLANKPDRIAMEALAVGAPELLAGALKVPGRMANMTPFIKGLPELLTAQSLKKGNPQYTKAAVYASAKRKLELGVPATSSSKAIEFTQKEVNNLRQRTDDLLAAADQSNLTWNPAEITKAIQDKIDEFRLVPGSSYGEAYVEALTGIKQKIVDKYKKNFGKDQPLTELRNDRTQLGKELRDTFEVGKKTGDSKLSAKQKAEQDHYFTRTSLLKDKAKGLSELDDLQSSTLDLLNMLKNREQARFHGGTSGPGLTGIVGAETSLRGGPGTLSTITAFKYVSSFIEDIIGTHLYNRFNAKPIMKGPIKRNAALNATRAYSMGSAYDTLLEDEINGP